MHLSEKPNTFFGSFIDFLEPNMVKKKQFQSHSEKHSYLNA